MNEKCKKCPFLKGKGAAIGIVVCFMAVLAVVGTYTVGNYEKRYERADGES